VTFTTAERASVQPDLPRPSIPLAEYGGLAALYLVAHFALNLVTDAHAIRGTGITLWSPDNGLSVILIMRSAAFAPIVFLAQVLEDLFIASPHAGYATILASEATLAFGYTLIAIALRDFGRFDLRSVSYNNLLALVAVVPAGAAITGLLYCGSLLAAGAFGANSFLNAFMSFWIGDTSGMGVTLPAAAALYDIYKHARWRRREAIGPFVAVAAICLMAGVLIFASVADPQHKYMFNTVFPAIFFIAAKYGFSGVSLALLFMQVTLVVAVGYHNVGDADFSVYQLLMFMLAVSGQSLGAAISDARTAQRLAGQQRAELDRVATRATTGAMAVAMAHEISQPLAALNNYVHSARRLLDAGKPETLTRQALLRAESEAARARQIIERIRDFVAGGDLQRETIDLREIVDKIFRLNGDVAAALSVDLAWERADRACVVEVDRIAIEQAVNNLVANAIDAAAEGGRHVWIRLSRHPGGCAVSVHDDGPGVDPEIADRLFEAFETTKAKGMGLGLPLTMQIARKHEGRIFWRAGDGAGAVFVLELLQRESEGSHDQA